MAQRFILSDSMRSYFNNFIKKDNNLNYLEQFCLLSIMGMAKDKKGVVETSRSQDMVTEFVGRTKANQDLIRALGFYRFKDDKNDPIKLFDKFFNERPMTKLSNEAYDLFNEYAAGGFEIIIDSIDDPTDLETFVIDYLDLLN